MSTTSTKYPRVVAPRLTAGDLRRCAAHLPDDAPVEFGFGDYAPGGSIPAPQGFELRPSGVDLHITIDVGEGC